MTRHTIKLTSFKKTFLSYNGIGHLLQVINKKGHPAKCNKLFIRLMIEEKGAKIPILVDGDGNVSQKGEGYALRPSDHLVSIAV